MDRGRAAAIEEARAQAEVDAELSQPSAAPDPMRSERKDDCGEDRSGGAAGRQPPAVRSRAPGKHGGQSYGQELKE